MEIHQLRYFLAVAETRSFSRAARRCHVAQPSLSQQVAKLEANLGHRLFERLPRGAALTDAGRALLPYARRILADLNAAEAHVRADLDAGRGALRVGAIPTMAPYLLPPLVQRFVEQAPECALTLREDLTERLIESLVAHELDLAIMSTPVETDVVALDVLGRERLVLASSKELAPSPARARLAVSDLRDQPAVVLHEMHCLGQQIESFCAARHVSRRIVCRTTQLTTVLALVGMGLGISLVPEMCAAGDGSKQRVYRHFGRAGPSREIAVAYRPDRTRSRLSRLMVALLREEVTGGGHRYASP